MNLFVATDIIKFLNDDNNYKINLKTIDQNLIQLIFDNKPSSDILISGFDILNEYDFTNQSDNFYHNYNTIYRELDNIVILSNNESVFVEVELPELQLPDIKYYQNIKNEYLSNICNNMIIGGVDVEIDGNIEHFSYKDEDQINIKELFDISNITQVPMYYHSDGNSCKLYTVEQIAQIYINNATNKFHHTTYINQLKRYVNELENIEEIESVEYGDDLTGEYLDTYNLAMNQFKLMIESMIGGKLNEGENN